MVLFNQEVGDEFSMEEEEMPGRLVRDLNNSSAGVAAAASIRRKSGGGGRNGGAAIIGITSRQHTTEAAAVHVAIDSGVIGMHQTLQTKQLVT